MVASLGSAMCRSGGWLPLVGLNALAGAAISLSLPLALGRGIDALIAGTGAGPWLAVCAGLVLANVVIGLIDSFAGTAAVAGATAKLRRRLVKHLHSVHPADARRFDTGDLVARVVGNAPDAARAGLSVVLIGVAAVPPIASVVLLAWLDVWLAVALVGGLVLIALILRAFTRQTGEIIAAYQRIQGAIAARLAEALVGIRTIAAAGTAAQEEDRILRRLPQLRAKGIDTWRVVAKGVGQAGIAAPLLQVAVLAVGGFALVDGRITTGELFSASQYAALGAGLGGLTGLLGQFARARAAIRRADEVLALPSVHYGPSMLPDGLGRLEFHSVSLRVGETTLLDGVDLTIPGGAAIAVVGRSGAGKSVLVALAARLQDPDEGRILLDGVDLREIAHDELRAAVGCAFERPVLVGETIAAVIGMGGDHWPHRVRAAAEATCAHDFISKLPNAYDTALHDAPMSGGEAQRLGLARAWRAERVLVLDDATSSLDMVTEMQISQTLTEDRRRRTRLIVTHRLATAARADLVVWLELGRVKAVASHETLWRDPQYRRIFHEA
jgi:ATP-binding cassette subfamily B protein